MNQQKVIPFIIEQKITKVSGQIGVKKYQRCQLLGIGANSKCYKCTNLESMDQFAVKIISKNDFKTKNDNEKILSQINIHKTLYHENIVKFVTAFQDKNFIYIFTQLCQNQTLLELIKKEQKLTIKEVKNFIIQIIQAVEYMHQNQIIHRDLKLANIFLNETMQIKVGDFGEATKLQFADEKKISVCGTLNYLAPEIVSGPFGHSYEVDFWAIGVVSFAMLFSKSPFQSKDENETLERIKQCKYEFPNVAVPSEAKDFIKRILVRDPKERMNLQQMLQHPFILKKQTKQVQSKSLLNRIFSRKIFKSNIFEPVGSLLTKSKSSQNLQKSFALRQAFSPKAEQKTSISFSKTQNNKCPQLKYVDCFLDFSKKYGFGYLIRKNNFGIIFNDGSIISSDEDKKYFLLKSRKIYYVKNPKIQSARVEEYLSQNVPHDRDFQKKYLLLDRFICLLKIQSLKNSQFQNTIDIEQGFVYVKQWWKNSKATMFSLSNNHFQVSFNDGFQTIFDPSKNTILIKSNDKKKIFFEKIDDALTSQDCQLKKKSLYTKEIYISIQRKRII